MTPSSLLALEGKLVEAKGPSRELDAMIAVATFHAANSPDELIYATVPAHDDHCTIGTYWRHSRSGMSLRTAPPYTDSIEAALARVSRCGWHWSVVDDPPSARLWPSPSIDRDGCLERTAIVEAATPALAICLALIRALAAKEQ